MSLADWVVLILTLAGLVTYGLWKGRGNRSVEGLLLADRRLPWYAVGLSIMATQASAITFTSTPGQAYADGMRFVQYYFGLPLAMIVVSIVFVPLYRSSGVTTAYEYLEHRFDAKTRTLASVLFLIQRGLGAGMTIYAPSLILSVMLGWDIRWTSAVIGGAIILYMSVGGVKAVNWADVPQFSVILLGMVIAFVAALRALPSDIGFVDALRIAGTNGRMAIIDTSLDPQNRYTIWSGLIGGFFIAMAYFGTDQSQVQRYLTGASIAESRLGLLLNGIAKVPMQFFILLIGVIVFAVFQFERPPLVFNPVEVQQVKAGASAPRFAEAEERFADAHAQQQDAYRRYLSSVHAGRIEDELRSREVIRSLAEVKEDARRQARQAILANDPAADPNDTNYVFLTFVLRYLPTGLIGLLFACVFAASMSSSSGELSALATTSMVDIVRRRSSYRSDPRKDVLRIRILMAGWGVYAVVFAQYAARLGSLIEAVNIIGSLFYGTLLGIFATAIVFKRVGGTSVCTGAIVGESAVFACFVLTDISWLWYNVVGCLVTVMVAVVVQSLFRKSVLT